MNDTKEAYSENSTVYVSKTIHENPKDMARYIKCKDREEKYNENWKKNSVNIIDVVAKFTPNFKTTKQSGYKFVYYNDRYEVKADMVAGYLRIYDKKLKKFVKLDGTPGTRNETHFKIKKKEEM